MRNLNLLIIIFLLNSMTVFGQKSINGKVVDETNLGLPGATLILFNQSDSLPKQRLMSDEHGKFSFDKISPGKYSIEVSYLNYQKLHQRIEVQKESVNNMILKLEPDQKLLSEVQVVAKKQALSVKAGKTTMNVEQSQLAQSQSAFDLLKSLPGVNVNKDGEIKVKGKSGVVVMIDGAPVEMGSNQLKSLLKSTPGTTLKTIEVMNHPPSSMDAAGNAGVINFVFNKKVKKGFNGSFSSGISKGRYYKTDQSLAFSYGDEKWDMNFLYAYDYDHSWQRDSLFRISTLSGESMRIGQVQINPTKSKGHLLKFGLERNFDDKNSLGFNFTFNEVKNPALGSTLTNFEKDNRPESLVFQKNDLRARLRNWEGILKYQHKFQEDRTLKSSFQATILDGNNREDYQISRINYPKQIGSYIRYRNSYPSKVDRFVFKADYAHKISDLLKFETGIKSSFSKIKNAQRAENYSDMHWTPDPSRGNQFQYKESIQAAYGSFELNTGYWNFKGGLRGEYTDVKGDSASVRNLVSQQYFSLFPNVEVAYTPNDHYSITLGFNRRIDRPEYDKLNPAVRYLDSYTIEKGNPYLRPQFSNNLELSQQFFKFIDLTVGYSALKDPLYYSFITTPNLQSYYTTINTGKQNQWTAAISFPIPGFSYWENYQSIYAYTTEFNALLEHTMIREKGKSLGFYSYNSFKLPWGLSMELSGWYESGGLHANFKYKPMAEVNVGMSRKFLNKKLNVGLSVSDLFYSGIFKADIVSNPDQTFKIDSRTDSRIFKLSLNWQFGKTNKKEEETKNRFDHNRFPGGKSKAIVKPD